MGLVCNFGLMYWAGQKGVKGLVILGLDWIMFWIRLVLVEITRAKVVICSKFGGGAEVYF